MNPSMDACFSLSAQICWNISALDQKPPHLSHSRIRTESIFNDSSFTEHRGHSPGFSISRSSTALPAAPQWLQNLLPRNIAPRQDGQPTVFKRERQNSHFALSLETAAPQLGQFSASGCITLLCTKPLLDGRSHFRDRCIEARPDLELFCSLGDEHLHSAYCWHARGFGLTHQGRYLRILDKNVNEPVAA